MQEASGQYPDPFLLVPDLLRPEAQLIKGILILKGHKGNDHIYDNDNDGNGKRHLKNILCCLARLI
jgi:hypothetical protein